MTTADAGLFERGEPGARAGAQAATGAPDFARHDRGDADDHWYRAVGQACGKCGAELSAIDFVRRRLDGTWVHDRCPRDPSAKDGFPAPAEAAEANEQ